MKAKFRGLTVDFSCLNCYAPYLHREVFWNTAVAGGVFNHPNLIFVGDLNFTLSDADIWGRKAHLDSLATFFLLALDAY